MLFVIMLIQGFFIGIKPFMENNTGVLCTNNYKVDCDMSPTTQYSLLNKN